MKECLFFSLMLPNHSITFCVFFHWFTFKIDRRCMFSLSKIDLLIFPESLLAGLMSRHFGLCSKFSFSILNVNQWRNTQNVIEWFGNIKEKNRHSFISFDIVDFYPSISENLLDQASWAFDLADISDEDISIIKHGIKKITAICLMLPWVAIWRGRNLRTGRSFHLKPSRQNVWQWKHRLIAGRRFGSYQKQISTFGRQNENRAPQSFRTIWLKNHSGSKFTCGKLSRCNFRPHYPKTKTL